MVYTSIFKFIEISTSAIEFLTNSTAYIFFVVDFKYTLGAILAIPEREGNNLTHDTIGVEGTTDGTIGVEGTV